MRKNFNSLRKMESESFYVTVCSNNNIELFENSIARFRNRLYKPIYFPSNAKFECALINLSFEVSKSPIDLKTAPILLNNTDTI